MSLTVFFSWQADTPTRVGRNLVERALVQAIKNINRDLEVAPAARGSLTVDSDTKGVGGFPPIVDTIFRKIDEAAIFLVDLTFVAQRIDSRPAPNPNVLIEYGWALKSLSHSRIVPLMNVAYGEPTTGSMPFDMAHLRRPRIQYNCAADATDQAIKNAREALTSQLEQEIRAVIDGAEFQSFAAGAFVTPAFVPVDPVEGKSRFRASMTALGKTFPHFAQKSEDVVLSGGPAFWIRLLPKISPSRRWSTIELKTAATSPNNYLRPLAAYGSGTSESSLRGEDGFGTYVHVDPGKPTPSVTYVFHSGELWAIDAYHANAEQGIFLPVDAFNEALNAYMHFLSRKLEIPLPYHCVLGAEGLLNRPVYVPTKPGQFLIQNPFGSCVSDRTVHETDIENFESSRGIVAAFFRAILTNCGYEGVSALDG